VGNSTTIDVHSCTFDRVLLYLEHAARGERFQFDPLLAGELREAAVTLGVQGLLDLCDQVLGSFTERVRRHPIRLSEVIARNTAGAAAAAATATTTTTTTTTTSPPAAAKRSETLLLMSGMVLDITRWLEEHPGGSSIIPEQALNVDCTVFFEIYHASKQSFLYLKEFYIGELALEDRPLVALPNQQQNTHPNDSNATSNAATSSIHSSSSSSSSNHASEAFMEQLNRVTSWRLDVHSLTTASAETIHKSF